MDIFADTGILLRLMEPNDSAHATMTTAVGVVRSRGDRLVITPQNSAEFWNVCTRPKSSRGGLGLSFKETERRLHQIEIGFPMLFEDPTSYSIWRQLVTRFGVQGKQVHDARLVALMQTYGLTHIMTLNGADFARYPGIVVIDPTKP